MRLGRLETKVSGLNMIPIVNIVFLILMFFMIVINFQNIKANERIRLPKQSLARPPMVRPEHELVLNFAYQRDAEGRRIRSLPEVFYNEHFVEVRQIAKDLQMERRVMERLHGPTVMKDITVLIRADSEIPNGLVQELVKKCQETGFTKFMLRPRVETL